MSKSSSESHHKLLRILSLQCPNTSFKAFANQLAFFNTRLSRYLSRFPYQPSLNYLNNSFIVTSLLYINTTQFLPPAQNKLIGCNSGQCVQRTQCPLYSKYLSTVHSRSWGFPFYGYITNTTFLSSGFLLLDC